MTDQPEALFLADELEAPLGTVISGEVDKRAAAELRRLHEENQGLRQAYIRMRNSAAELKILKQSEREGWRHADELEQERKRLSEVNIKLLGALDMIRETLNGGEVDDLLYIINTAIAKAEVKV